MANRPFDVDEAVTVDSGHDVHKVELPVIVPRQWKIQYRVQRQSFNTAVSGQSTKRRANE